MKKMRRQLLFRVAQLQKIESIHWGNHNVEDIDAALEALNLLSKDSESDKDSDSTFGSDTDNFEFSFSLARPNGESS